MPRLVYKLPSYRNHKASGQAVVTLDGQDHYLGPYGSAASKREYKRLIAQWQAADNQLPPPADHELTIGELIQRFWRHVKAYYLKNGKPTSEQDCFRTALKPVRKLYGHTPAVEFGPAAIKAIRQVYIEARWGRSSINRQIGRVRMMFKWAVENELVPATVLHALQAVSGLRKGRSAARETEPVKPVPNELVDAIKDHVSRQVWAMIELQRITGMRPGEVVIMRGCDIDTTGELWEYRPAEHKTEHHGRERIVHLGPKAQGIVKQFWRPKLQEYLFSPSEAEQARHEENRRKRVNKYLAAHPKARGDGIQPSQRDRRKARPETGPGGEYDTNTFRRAIERGCDKAFPLPKELAPHVRKWGEKMAKWHERTTPEQREAIRCWRKEHYWHPHQLRHNRATELRKRFGIEAARVILGHSSAAVTEIYAEMDHSLAAKIAREVG